MTENNKLTNAVSKATTNSSLSTRKPNSLLSPLSKTISSSGLHGRIASAKIESASLDVLTMPNRLGLMLDVSGSMQGQKIDSLKDAMLTFVNDCNPNDTCVAIETFGDETPHLVPLTMVAEPVVMLSVMGLSANGGTPLHEAMQYVLGSYSITRGIIVSDGDADYDQKCRDLAAQYRDAEISVDCVHIGHSHGGEELLRYIAELTGGLFIKFTNVSQFAKSFAYLSPTKRSSLMLCDDNTKRMLLGSDEVR